MTTLDLRGLDLVAHLNFTLPRDFLLQIEDEFAAFVCEECTDTSKVADADPQSGNVAKRIMFPPLAQQFENLLRITAARFCLEVSHHSDRAHRRCMIVTRVAAARSGKLPMFSYADFLRVQRPPGPSNDADAPAPSLNVQHMQRRLWALEMFSAIGAVENDGQDFKSAQQTSKDGTPQALRVALDRAFKCQAAQSGGRSGRNSDCQEAYARPPAPDGNALRKRGRGFADREAVASEPSARHNYARFGPDAPKRIYSRENFVQAPWPSAKLRRLSNPKIFWRPEWRVGPDDDQIGGVFHGWGNVLSWAVEPKDLSFGEGFEVSLRSGPGPAGHIAEEQANEILDRSDDDFVLSFRRGDGMWHFVAGRRARLCASPSLAEKALPDPHEPSISRQMFWVACVESRSDGKHYIVVGTVPGLLTNHFFVAKVGRAMPLSHAGFSYLPLPSKAAFGGDDNKVEPPPLVLESITVYPYALTGELPFVSMQFVDVRAVPSPGVVQNGEVDSNILISTVLPKENENDGESEFCIVRDAVRNRSSTEKNRESETERLSRLRSWSVAAKLEGGLLLHHDHEDPEQRLERRAKRRLESVHAPMSSNTLSAAASWEPQTVNEPKFGPFDDSARHDPLRWDPYSHFEL